MQLANQAEGYGMASISLGRIGATITKPQDRGEIERAK